MGLGTGCCDQGLGKGGLRRIEVSGVPSAIGGSCVDVGTHALAVAQFAVDTVVWGHQTGIQKGQTGTQGVEFLVVAKGVANVGDVAGGPVGHGGGIQKVR